MFHKSRCAKVGRVDESIAQYREALQREPRSAAIRVSLAQLLMQLGRHDEAFLEFQRAVELRPRDVDLRLQFAESLHSAQRTDEALRVLDVVVGLAPNHPRLWFDAGVNEWNKKIKNTSNQKHRDSHCDAARTPLTQFHVVFSMPSCV